VLLAVSLIVLASRLLASERGYPLLRSYPHEEYGGGVQNYGIAQAPDGVLYAGNLQGVLAFDGAAWKLVEIANQSAVFDVAIAPTGRIAAGGVSEFGFLDRDRSGSLVYRSLIGSLPAGEREIGDVRKIFVTGSRFLFAAASAVYESDGERLRVVARFPANPRTPRAFMIGGTLHVATAGGLLRLNGSTLERVDEITGPIDLMLDDGDGAIVCIRGRGLVRWKQGRVEPFAAEASAWLSKREVVTGLRLPDGRIVIASRLDGLLVLESDGSIAQLIDQRAGIPDSAIRNIFCDRDGALWIAGTTIQRVELASELTLFDSRAGLRGAVQAATRYRGVLYAGTDAGLFAIRNRGVSDEAAAVVVPGIQQTVWSFAILGEDLLVGSGEGVFVVRGDAPPRQIAGTDGIIAYTLTQSSSDPDRVWVGGQEGLSMLRRSRGEWRVGPRVPGTPGNMRSIVEIDGVLWCGTTFAGVIRIDLGDGDRVARVTRIGPGEMSTIVLDGHVLVTQNDHRVQRIGANGTSLAPDPRFSFLSNDAYKAAVDASGAVWFASSPPRYVSRRGAEFERTSTSVIGIGGSRVAGFFCEPDGTVWLGTNRGLYRHQKSARAVGPLPSPLIRRVTSGEQQLAGEAGVARALELEHDFPRLRIEYAPVVFGPGTLYQFRLDPVDSGWSKPSVQPFTEFTNLSERDYTFRIRTTSSDGRVSPEALFSFRVMPPWYRTRWAYALWLLCLIGLVLAYNALHTRNLRSHAEELRALVAERTGELQQRVEELREAQQQLVRQNALLDEANHALEGISLEDSLTGIANRRSFDKAFEEEWRRARRAALPIALVTIDIDHFKELNDSHGHPAGDAWLRAVARYLRDTVRRTGDVVARYGGEEFAVLLPNTDTAGAVLVAEHLRVGLEALRIGPEGAGVSVTASFGVASIVPDSDDSSLLVRMADSALYDAKESGRNRVAAASGNPEDYANGHA
jgi:diguanylate cyclase (GGDEF)-like protein